MYHDYFSVEQFMRQHQGELLGAAARDRAARAAARASRAARQLLEQRTAVRRATPLESALAGFGHQLVTLGHRLEQLAAAAPKPRAVCEDQPTAAG